MMIWYKTWLESRARFLLGVAMLLGLCVGCILFESQIRARFGSTGSPSNTYSGYVHKVTSGVARGLFMIWTLLLGLGGLQPERDHGTVGFTLALPARRWRLVAIRAAVGLLELVMLALVPALVIPTLSPLVHQSYPLAQALDVAVLWIGGYAPVFAMAFLLSTLLSEQYMAFLLTWVVLLTHALIAAVPGIKPYRLSIQWITSGLGMSYFNSSTALIVGPLPWLRLLVLTAIAVGLLVSAGWIAERQDF